MSTRFLSSTVISELLVLLALAAGCSERSPVGPSEGASTGPSSAPPSIEEIRPPAGSTGGSTPLTISGSGFQPGATVMFGEVPAAAVVTDERTIDVSTPTHLAGPVDVTVTDPDGRATTLTRGYTYVRAASFDFDGEWIGGAGTDHELQLRFTVRDHVLVSVSCGGSAPLTFSPPPQVSDGQFSIVRDDGVGVSARIVSATDAVGTINIAPCESANWVARRSGA